MRTRVQTQRHADGIVGAARMGLTLAHQIAANGHDVVLLTTMEERAAELRETGTVAAILPELSQMHPRVLVTTDPQVLGERATLIFVTISDSLLTRVLDLLGDHLDGANMIVHATHSLYGTELQRSSELIEAHTCVKQVGVLAGPLHMSEILTEMPNVALVGSEFPEVVRRVREVLGTEHIHIYGSPDLRGIEFAAALHQVVVLAIGMVDGTELGSATHAAYVAAGLQEIMRVGVALGAQEDSFYGLVGVGRIVDALQSGGNDANYRVGHAFVRAKDPAAVLQSAPPEAKSLEVIDQLVSWSATHGVELVFVPSIAAILAGEVDAATTLRGMLRHSDVFSLAE